MVAEDGPRRSALGSPVETPTGNMVTTSAAARLRSPSSPSRASSRHLHPHRRLRAGQAIVQFMRKITTSSWASPRPRRSDLRSAPPRHGDERRWRSGPRPRVGHPRPSGPFDRDPRGGARSHSADRGRVRRALEITPPSCAERHRGSRIVMTGAGALIRARHPARPGNGASDPRRRGPAHLRGPGLRAYPRRLEKYAASCPSEHDQRVGTLVHRAGTP